MKTKKAIKKSAKIVAMAAVAASAQVIDLDYAAYQQAMADMADEYGQGHVAQIAYMPDPFGGLIAWETGNTKIPIKREQSHARMSYAEREGFGWNINYHELNTNYS